MPAIMTNDSLLTEASYDSFATSDSTDCLLFGSENFSSELDEELVEIDLLMEAQESAAPIAADDNEFGSYTAYVHSFRAITPPLASAEDTSRTISRSRGRYEACEPDFDF